MDISGCNLIICCGASVQKGDVNILNNYIFLYFDNNPFDNKMKNFTTIRKKYKIYNNKVNKNVHYSIKTTTKLY